MSNATVTTNATTVQGGFSVTTLTKAAVFSSINLGPPVNGTAIRFAQSSSPGSVFPKGIDVKTTYYVIDSSGASGGWFGVSLTPMGPTADIQSMGTGTFTVVNSLTTSFNFTVTSPTTTAVLSTGSWAPPANGAAIRFSKDAAPGSVFPKGIDVKATYYVINSSGASGASFGVSLTPMGPTADIQSTGNGLYTALISVSKAAIENIKAQALALVQLCQQL